MIKQILDIEPQLKRFKGIGREPSLRRLIESYYTEFFPSYEVEGAVREYIKVLKQQLSILDSK